MAYGVQLFAVMNNAGSTSVQPVEVDEVNRLKTDAELVSGDDIQVVGAAAHDAAVSGNPVLNSGESRTTNPTAVADGDVVREMNDDVGRRVMQPLQVRDLLQTAHATVSNITETSLLAGSSGVFHDLIFITAANNSDAAVTIDVRQTTGGTVQLVLTIPANDTASIAPPTIVPQDHADATWTFRNSSSDDSTTTIDVTGLFATNV